MSEDNDSVDYDYSSTDNSSPRRSNRQRRRSDNVCPSVISIFNASLTRQYVRLLESNFYGKEVGVDCQHIYFQDCLYDAYCVFFQSRQSPESLAAGAHSRHGDGQEGFPPIEQCVMRCPKPPADVTSSSERMEGDDDSDCAYYALIDRMGQRLGEIPTLSYIDFCPASGTGGGRLDTRAAACILRHTRQVKEIWINFGPNTLDDNNEYCTAGLASFAAALQDHPSIMKVRLIDCFEDTPQHLLQSVFLSLPNLQVFIVHAEHELHSNETINVNDTNQSEQDDSLDTTYKTADSTEDGNIDDDDYHNDHEKSPTVVDNGEITPPPFFFHPSFAFQLLSKPSLLKFGLEGRSRVTKKQWNAIMSAISNRKNNLQNDQRLAFSSSNTKNDACTTTNSRLLSLTLDGHCQLPNHFVNELSRALDQNTTLTTLDLHIGNTLLLQPPKFGSVCNHNNSKKKSSDEGNNQDNDDRINKKQSKSKDIHTKEVVKWEDAWRLGLSIGEHPSLRNVILTFPMGSTTTATLPSSSLFRMQTIKTEQWANFLQGIRDSRRGSCDIATTRDSKVCKDPPHLILRNFSWTSTVASFTGTSPTAFSPFRNNLSQVLNGMTQLTIEDVGSTQDFCEVLRALCSSPIQLLKLVARKQDDVTNTTSEALSASCRDRNRNGNDDTLAAADTILSETITMVNSCPTLKRLSITTPKTTACKVSSMLHFFKSISSSSCKPGETTQLRHPTQHYPEEEMELLWLDLNFGAIVRDGSTTPLELFEAIASNFSLFGLAGEGLLSPTSSLSSSSVSQVSTPGLTLSNDAFLQPYESLLRSVFKMNFAGRKYILQDPTNHQRGSLVLGVVQSDSLDAVFYHVRENPFLCHRSPMPILERQQLQQRQVQKAVTGVTSKCIQLCAE